MKYTYVIEAPWAGCEIRETIEIPEDVGDPDEYMAEIVQVEMENYFPASWWPVEEDRE